ncbi:hypothetical protein VNO78_24544 [Psophocarpus tetragonolobus]|uniref:Uncharacterized protein n=1 Tax=Psophocarpus tetragonolobus TaxID=3891 RepID=A0AAN9S8A2_PSOTE
MMFVRLRVDKSSRWFPLFQLRYGPIYSITVMLARTRRLAISKLNPAQTTCTTLSYFCQADKGNSDKISLLVKQADINIDINFHITERFLDDPNDSYKAIAFGAGKSACARALQAMFIACTSIGRQIVI